jgi:hypothetical protein
MVRKYKITKNLHKKIIIETGLHKYNNKKIT